jgi:hypothetical protein
MPEVTTLQPQHTRALKVLLKDYMQSTPRAQLQRLLFELIRVSHSMFAGVQVTRLEASAFSDLSRVCRTEGCQLTPQKPPEVLAVNTSRTTSQLQVYFCKDGKRNSTLRLDTHHS